MPQRQVQACESSHSSHQNLHRRPLYQPKFTLNQSSMNPLRLIISPDLPHRLLWFPKISCILESTVPFTLTSSYRSQWNHQPAQKLIQIHGKSESTILQTEIRVMFAIFLTEVYSKTNGWKQGNTSVWFQHEIWKPSYGFPLMPPKKCWCFLLISLLFRWLCLIIY